MWYTADEPDGWSYALNSTQLAYTQLRELDPYHPVSLVLNCQNFHYSDYAAGADIVWQDAYPVGINATNSVKWSTSCNTTYGDCGCDNCRGSLLDVANRLDDIQSYQSSIAYQDTKPTWSVLQAFGAQDYWPRLPSAAEVVNMMMLSVNHGAKGITYWLYPSTDDVNIASGAFGKTLDAKPTIDYLFGTEPVRTLKVKGSAGVDASAWVLDGNVLVGIANGLYTNSSDEVAVVLPDGLNVTSVDKLLYGEVGWSLKDGNLAKTGLGPLEVGIVLLK